jgi:hypothetical protein
MADLLMLQVHALSVADVPEIGAAFRKGLQTIAKFVKSRSGASDDGVDTTTRRSCEHRLCKQEKGPRSLWAAVNSHRDCCYRAVD